MLHVRPAAVAGTFYPSVTAELLVQVDSMLGAAEAPPAGATPKALIVPHAGYVYSGPIAASAYATLRGGRGIRRVVLLGPAHRVRLRGLALPEADAFATPLGPVALDPEAPARIPWVPRSGAAHLKEHSLEVQLPFLIRALALAGAADFRLVPLAVGDAPPEEVERALDALWGGPETLVVVSSDLSHYLPYRLARSVDAATAQAILDLGAPAGGPITHEQACGATPVNGLLLAGRRRRLRPVLLDLRSSGDTAGSRAEVVGYAAFAFYEEPGGAARQEVSDAR
jgi:hypothetical protein